MNWARVGAWVSTWLVATALGAGCGTASQEHPSNTSTSDHRVAPAAPGGSASMQNRHILQEPLPRGVKTETDLYNWLLWQRLAEINNPAQGEICLDAACKIAATVFSGPAKAAAGTPVTLVAFSPRAGWQVLVGPLPQSDNPPRQAQSIQASLRDYPRKEGVCVVQTHEIDWYWIQDGHLQLMRQPRA
ncbi:hypothetical protein [Alicyclobacillus vulcanalis]|uniref:Lipoprotein n=1 Tax=Alicyclobacillus vulcanalis TaxID=252246 RepID=A0A1N7M4H9_9BACL|nr:hypothetical protein [Alicyclobacillus vulcanalis]SIS81010.1 hypothetical protein SAMN05421799_104221 [Alicyclobacillus vulcanalis]